MIETAGFLQPYVLPIEQTIKLGRRDIKDRVMRGQRFLGHPGGNAIVFRSKASLTIEFPFCLQGFASQYLEEIRGYTPTIATFYQPGDCLGGSTKTKACEDAGTQGIVASHVDLGFA